MQSGSGFKSCVLGRIICISMGVEPSVNRGTCPLLFEVEETPFVLSPCFFGYRHFRTNAHGRPIHWMIGAIFVEFNHLILMKVIKIVATRCQILRPKCTKFSVGWGSATDPAGKLTVLPKTL